MTPFEQHKLIEKILWGLKIPEILSTIIFIPGFILFVLGVIGIEIPFYAFVLRLVLFFVRIGIVKVKRGLEKKYNIAKTTYIPTIIKKGTQKVEFIHWYK